ncbi:MAG: hypothetical protein ACKO7P_07010 [Bacteroidota bacterium]
MEIDRDFRGMIDEQILNEFITYYNNQFKDDLEHFFALVPEQSKYHEDREEKKRLAIQYEYLTPEKNSLYFLRGKSKLYFCVALFHTILIDMAFYTHFRNSYEKFQKYTMYPKLIGNCLSSCHIHLHPYDIFRAVYGMKSFERNSKTVQILFITVPFIQKELTEFLEKYPIWVNSLELCSILEREIGNLGAKKN